MNRHFPLHVHIGALFVALIVLVGGLIAGLSYSLSRDMLEEAAEDLTRRIGRETLGELQRLLGPAEMAVGLLARDTVVQARGERERRARIAFLRDALLGSPALSSLYVGYANGDFFFLRRIHDDAEARALAAPAGSAFMLQSIERGPGAARGRHVFLDPRLAVLREDDRPEYAAGYDPRTRAWYREAVAASGRIRTAPYLFFSNRKVGMTIALQTPARGTVVGADLTLATLGASLARQKVTPATEVALVDAMANVVAHEDVARLVTVPPGSDARPTLTRLEDLGHPALARLAGAVREHRGAEPRALRIDAGEERWRASVSPVALEAAQPLYLAIAIPDRELLAGAHALRRNSALVTLVILVLAVPVAWLTARSIAGPLRQLAEEAEAIRRFDFRRPIGIRSRILEVNDLAVTMDGMKRAIRRFLDLSQAVAAEENFERLLPLLLAETMSAADAQAGVLYLEDEGRLVPGASLGADGAAVQGLPPLQPGAAGPLLAGADAAGQPMAGPLGAEDLAAAGLGPLAAACGARHAIAVPLVNRQHQRVGAMLLLRKDPAESAQVAFVQALSGSAATSLETRELILAQKRLFEAFIQLIAGAIDAKSPYTGGHCARVPELTKMLARAACAQSEGPFRDFSLDEQGWEAVHVAAWLHDCGKVTTPEYVVDKATKLETIYDRIHEVRMRFEVLKRDAVIQGLEAILAGADAAAERAAIAEAWRRLDEEFAFVAACNEGGEFFGPDKVARLRAIGERTWQRTLDDRAGISQEEKARRAREPAAPLPATEPLLADKPEHRIERRAQDRIPEDNPWGFRMAVPELLYHRGELHNLSVGRGTLSDEDRYKINEHIVQTLIMLSQLPFPKHLRQVPEIAGGHHEKMDGTGYPRRLTKDQMSPVARMMAIADIFEALTAVDRPYKKGKTLSEALRIMCGMCRDRHVDPDLFELFLTSGVYRDYAERFLQPGQIDAVDVAACMAAARA